VPGGVQDLLQADAVRLGGLARLGDGGMAQAMWPDLQPGIAAQIPEHPLEADAGEPLSVLRPVEIREQGACRFTPDVQPCLESASRGFRDAQDLS